MSPYMSFKNNIIYIFIYIYIYIYTYIVFFGPAYLDLYNRTQSVQQQQISFQGLKIVCSCNLSLATAVSPPGLPTFRASCNINGFYQATTTDHNLTKLSAYSQGGPNNLAYYVMVGSNFKCKKPPGLLFFKSVIGGMLIGLNGCPLSIMKKSGFFFYA